VLRFGKKSGATADPAISLGFLLHLNPGSCLPPPEMGQIQEASAQEQNAAGEGDCTAGTRVIEKNYVISIYSKVAVVLYQNEF